MRRDKDRVSVRMPSQIIDRAGRRARANAWLEYRAIDPYAVALTISRGSGAGTTWIFARELLTCGLREPVGDGDVVVVPGPIAAQAAVLVGVRTGAADAVVEFPGRSLGRFLRRTYNLVPTGREGDFLDIDRLTRRLSSQRSWR
jgi:hypothetical protein